MKMVLILKVLGIALMYFVMSKEFCSLELSLRELHQLFFIYWGLFNWCYLIFSFIFFLAFLTFTLTPLLVLSSMDINSLYSSICFGIFHFHLGCLKPFYLGVIVTGLITVIIAYIISFKSVRFGLKSCRRSSMVYFAKFINIRLFLSFLFLFLEVLSFSYQY